MIASRFAIDFGNRATQKEKQLLVDLVLDNEHGRDVIVIFNYVGGNFWDWFGDGFRDMLRRWFRLIGGPFRDDTFSRGDNGGLGNLLLGLFDIVVVAEDGVSRARIVGIVEFDVWDRCMRGDLGRSLDGNGNGERCILGMQLGTNRLGDKDLGLPT